MNESTLSTPQPYRNPHAGKIVTLDNGLGISDCITGHAYPLNVSAWPIDSIVQFLLVDDAVSEIKLLAEPASAAAKIFHIAAQYRLDQFFSPDVMAEVAAILDQPSINDPQLEDYEDKPFCTIDGATTRDLDQAVFIASTPSGFTVFYAIADAAYYVRPGSALFREALARGASYYLPGLMIPMLPRELCEGVISLNADAPRRAVVFELSLDAEGRHQQTRITRARIKSRAKLSFGEVQAFLDTPQDSPLTTTALSTSLSCLKKVGQLRLNLAEERKVVRYHRTEIDIQIGQGGLVFNLLDNIRDDVELYNEQLSLLCNSKGAELLADGDTDQDNIQPIYKIHNEPPEDKLVQFEQTLTGLIERHHLPEQQWYWDQRSPMALSDYLKNLPQAGEHARIAKAVNRQALMVNNRSQFSEQAGQHYGVGAEVYARFSAPMREIVGIFLHKELLEKTGLQEPLASAADDEDLRDAIILAANQAKDLQTQLTKAANKLVLDQLFAADVQLPQAQRPQRTGTVIGLNRDKLYILLDDPEIEVKLHIPALAARWKCALALDDGQISLLRNHDHSIVASLGDGISITVADKDTVKDRWLFDLFELDMP